MALFIDLDDDEVEPPHNIQNGKPVWNGDSAGGRVTTLSTHKPETEEAHQPAARENPNRNSMTAALGCYPIVMAVASSIDLNSLDNLSRTCHQIRSGLLQYRKVLLASTLHCSNEQLPIDADEVLRYRARASNWHYMEDAGRASSIGKSGTCARDMVSECRRCGTVVCRNCAIKPPAPIVFRERHRRLCVGCTKAPIGALVKPPLPPGVSLNADVMRTSICACATQGVWLCQPCGRSIRGGDHEYQAIWKWRNQYGEVLGGLGTGIGEGDRGVVCGREIACASSKEKEQETDCDAEDAREADFFGATSISQTVPSPWGGPGSLGSLGSLSNSSLGTHPRTPDAVANLANRRTPSPALGPGYARHEIEGIGGVVKRKRVRMIRVGAGVPEWVDEKARGEILGREVSGRVRSWCGWCWRVIPGAKDYETERKRNQARPEC